MKAEEVFKAGLGALVVYPKWHKNGKDRVFRIRGYELGEEYVSLTDGVIQTKTHISFIKPIPLTPDEFVKLGFELEKDKTWWRKGFISINPKNGFVHFDYDRRDAFEFFTVNSSNCKHVHQLQNLYHSLKGEELQYKND